MGVNLENGYEDLSRHVGHDIVCVMYAGPHVKGEPMEASNVAVECDECGEVLFDFERPTFASGKGKRLKRWR